MPPRHRLVEEPTSRLAVIARWLSIFAFPVALLAIIIQRAGMLELIPVLATFAAALLLAALGILLGLAAFVVIWRSGIGGMRHAVAAIALGVVMLAYPAYFAIKGYYLPAISDITTDPIDPPRFDALARLRTRDTNPAAYAGLYAAELQRAAYPDIEPLNLSVAPQAAYEATRAAVIKRHWNIIAERPPTATRRDGQIEAVARTMIMGFRDDVSIRVRAFSGGSRIDVRSASRYGRHDFGANAARVRLILDDIDDLANVEKPERPAPKMPTKGKGAQPAKR
jgi:uncharacterized protein (DUF1499 family)